MASPSGPCGASESSWAPNDGKSRTVLPNPSLLLPNLFQNCFDGLWKLRYLDVFEFPEF